MKMPVRLGAPLESAVRQVLARFGVGITSHEKLQRMMQSHVTNEQAAYALKLLLEYPDASLPLDLLRRSRSQIKQDLFVLLELKFKRDGFFVEFGAANGVDASNSHLLEKEFGWTGILAEPARVWHQALAANRSARLDKRCVWSTSGARLSFNEVEDALLSTVDSFSAGDQHKEARRRGSKYEVETISLVDLLDAHDAPKRMDYLSIDTEGSERAILEHFDFDRYRFRIITCEHNFRPEREAIHSLLTANGYVRKLTHVSQFDDWYVCA